MPSRGLEHAIPTAWSVLPHLLAHPSRELPASALIMSNYIGGKGTHFPPKMIFRLGQATRGRF